MFDPHPPDCECGPHAVPAPDFARIERDNKARDILASIRVGVCNADSCDARTEINDVFCTDDFRRLPKPLRDELRQAREVVRRNGGRALVNAEAAYNMRIVGARLWLKKNAEATK